MEINEANEINEINGLEKDPVYLELKRKIGELDYKYSQLDAEYDSYLQEISELRKKRCLVANSECEN